MHDETTRKIGSVNVPGPFVLSAIERNSSVTCSSSLAGNRFASNRRSKSAGQMMRCR
jgi:hypothetical protein